MRFRAWLQGGTSKNAGAAPQHLQKTYPQWDELAVDVERVNEGLVYYRRKLEEIVRLEVMTTSLFRLVSSPIGLAR